MKTPANVFLNSQKIISSEIGLLSRIAKLCLMNRDPQIIGYGIWPCDTSTFSQEKFGGRSSGVARNWEGAILGTVGETVERYASVFYDLNEATFSSYKNLNQKAIHPSEFAIFHPKQFEQANFNRVPFTEDTEVHWMPTVDLTNGETVLCPGAFIYLPWFADPEPITLTASSGLAAHTNVHKAMLTGIYELIERDSFMITWMQRILPPKLVISKAVRGFLNEVFPAHYEWHFFDMTYDLEVPTVLGICVGETDFGQFIAAGAATRATLGEALQKTAIEIGQGVGYYRHLLGEKKDWMPSDDFSEILDFEMHSIFYTKRKDLRHVFDPYLNAKAEKHFDFNERSSLSDQDQLKSIFQTFKDKGYNVLFKDITTPDVRQLGFYSIRMFAPQLIPLSGAYPYYFNGGKRLYEVPKTMGYKSYDYDNLNPYPHPFP